MFAEQPLALPGSANKRRKEVNEEGKRNGEDRKGGGGTYGEERNEGSKGVLVGGGVWKERVERMSWCNGTLGNTGM